MFGLVGLVVVGVVEFGLIAKFDCCGIELVAVMVWCGYFVWMSARCLT